MSTAHQSACEVAVIGAGVVGCATALALARRGVATMLIEAETEPGLAASGTNSGILHTGFDSTPGELETRLILRSAELRDPVIDALGIPALRCGAVMAVHASRQREEIVANAQANGVQIELTGNGALIVPGESVTDPVAYTLALQEAACRHGAELRTSYRVIAIDTPDEGLVLRSAAGAPAIRCRIAVNCAGLYADAVARLAGDATLDVYPRKGEFVVFEPDPAGRLDHILLPVPTRRTKGVLVFPTVDGKVVAGPTAVDIDDKEDWTVRPQARDEILPKAMEMYPPLSEREPIATYAGLRPAGRDSNYVIAPSGACPRLVKTSAVKAVLFDTDLHPVAEARREKALSYPQPGWVEQDPEEVLAAVVDAVAELLSAAPGPVVACGLDHQGESVLAWDAETGEALTPIVTWQDKRSQEVLDRLEAENRSTEIQARSGMPLDPYFSAAKLTWLLEHDERTARAVQAGTARLGTVDSFLCDRLGAGHATDPSTASRTQLGAPEWDPQLLRIFGVPANVLPRIEDTAGELGTLHHPSWPTELPLRARCVDQQAALAGAGCVKPGLVKATYGTGVFVLAHAGDERPSPGGGLLPTIAWRIDGRVEWAIDGGVFTAGALLAWLSRDLGLAADPAALAAKAAEVPDAAGVRVLPALAGVGAPWWRPSARAVIAGMTAGTRPPHIARAALEAIAWRVADVLSVVRETVPVDVLRVDGGLTREATLLALQADAAGVAVQRGAVDATVAGAAALAAVGAGIWSSTLEIADRIPVGERVLPRRDDGWRAAGHAAWREFVERAVAL